MPKALSINSILLTDDSKEIGKLPYKFSHLENAKEKSKRIRFAQLEKFYEKCISSGFKMRLGMTSDCLMFTKDTRTNV